MLLIMDMKYIRTRSSETPTLLVLSRWAMLFGTPVLTRKTRKPPEQNLLTEIYHAHPPICNFHPHLSNPHPCPYQTPAESISFIRYLFGERWMRWVEVGNLNDEINLIMKMEMDVGVQARGQILAYNAASLR